MIWMSLNQPPARFCRLRPQHGSKAIKTVITNTQTKPRIYEALTAAAALPNGLLPNVCEFSAWKANNKVLR